MIRYSFILKWSLATTAAAAVGWELVTFGTILLMEEASFSPPVALALTVVVAVLLFAGSQWLLLRETNPILWILATITGILIGFPPSSLAAFMAVAAPQATGITLPLPGLPRTLAIFVMSTIGGLPGGLLSGVLQRIAIRRGHTLITIAVFMLAWGLGYGTAHAISHAVRGSIDVQLAHGQGLIAGGSGGLIYGVIIGAYLSLQIDLEQSPTGA